MMADMPAHPLPGHLVAVHLFIEHLPEVGVLHRLLGGGLPAALLPVGHPLGDAFHHVLRVGHQGHFTGALERGQALDGGHQLHAVVGGIALPTPELALGALVDQQCAPAARAGIALAGAVGIDLYQFAHLSLMFRIAPADLRHRHGHQLAHRLAPGLTQRAQADHQLARHQ
ncbi:hypothetical protein FQZ97_1024740 [compost metagenome]